MITKEDFWSYEAVRKSGVTNMFNVIKVSQFSGLSSIRIKEIMKNYTELQEKFK